MELIHSEKIEWSSSEREWGREGGKEEDSEGGLFHLEMSEQEN